MKSKDFWIVIGFLIMIVWNLVDSFGADTFYGIIKNGVVAFLFVVLLVRYKKHR